MKRQLMKTGFLVLGMVGVMGLAETASQAKESPARAELTGEAAWARIRSLNANFTGERDAAEEAAVMGSYKIATQHFKSMKGILGMERVLLENLIATAAGGDELSMVRRALDYNTARTGEVKEMLRLLRVAGGQSY